MSGMAGVGDDISDKRCPNLSSSRPAVFTLRINFTARSLTRKTSVAGGDRLILPVRDSSACCAEDVVASKFPSVDVAASVAILSAAVGAFWGAALGSFVSALITLIISSAPARCITVLYFRAVALSQSGLTRRLLPLNNLSKVCSSAS